MHWGGGGGGVVGVVGGWWGRWVGGVQDSEEEAQWPTGLEFRQPVPLLPGTLFPALHPFLFTFCAAPFKESLKVCASLLRLL